MLGFLWLEKKRFAASVDSCSRGAGRKSGEVEKETVGWEEEGGPWGGGFLRLVQGERESPHNGGKLPKIPAFGKKPDMEKSLPTPNNSLVHPTS